MTITLEHSIAESPLIQEGLDASGYTGTQYLSAAESIQLRNSIMEILASLNAVESFKGTFIGKDDNLSYSHLIPKKAYEVETEYVFLGKGEPVEYIFDDEE